MAYNKFITKDGKVLLDLSLDAIATQYVCQGISFHGKDGKEYIGELEHKLQDKTVVTNGEVVADDGYYGLSKVIVDIPENTNTNTEFNIAYGETSPEDINKLWIKTAKPDNVTITPSVETNMKELEIGVATLPAAAGEIVHVKVGNKVYLFGGGKYSKLNTINVFNLVDNTITTLNTKLPTFASGIAAARVDNKIYLFGGEGGTNSGSSVLSDSINVFDLENKTITTLSIKLPVAANGMAAVAVDKNIYIFGGKKTYLGDKLDTILLFNTEHNTLTELGTKLPKSTCRMAHAKIGQEIYLFGGDSVGSNPTTDIYVFNIDTNTIRTLNTKLPVATEGLAAATIGNKVYLFGGSDTNALNTIKVFDIATQTIITLGTKLPTAISDIAACPVGTDVYLFGGSPNSGGVNSVNVFHTSLPLAKDTLLIETSQDKNIFEILPGLKIGINNIYLGSADNQGEKVPAHIGKIVNKYTYDNYYTSGVSSLGTETNTTLTSSINCTPGDLVVAAIANRDTLTLNEGWTLVSTSNTNSVDTGSSQRLSWAWKIAETSTESITVTQASAQRLYINMVVLPGATGVVDHGYTYSDTTDMASITANKPDGLVLWSLSSTTWGTTTPYGGWTTSEEMPIIQLDEANYQPRLGLGLDQSANTKVTFTCPMTASSGLIVGCLGIQGINKFYEVTSYTEAEWTEI